MDRLIDAYEFAKKLENTDANVCADYGDGFCEFGYSRSLLRLLLSETPTVDAVEVVRCKDCTKNGLFTCQICFIENKTLQFVNHSPDFYCGEGERRTDG